MEDEADRRAREIVDGLLESHGIVLVTPRSKRALVEKLSELLEEMPHFLAPPAAMLAEWFVAQDEVADLMADDEEIERVATAAGARPRSLLERPLLRDFAFVGSGWVATIDCEIGVGRTPASLDFGEGRAPPSKEDIARAEETVGRLSAFWPEIERALLDRMDAVADGAELRAALRGVVVHVGPELAPRWSVQLLLADADVGWIVILDGWTIEEVMSVR